MPVLRVSARDAGCDPRAGTFYLLDDASVLYRFDPSRISVSRVSVLTCAPQSSPYAMTVDPAGSGLLVLMMDWALYRAVPETGACARTALVPGSGGMPGNVGIAAQPSPRARFFLLGGDRLAAAEASDFVPTSIGIVSPPTGTAELHATPSGQLFAFHSHAAGAAISEIDPATARLVARDVLPGVSRGGAWTFAEWDGAFWLFNAESDASTSTVRRYDLATRSIQSMGALPARIPGAATVGCSGL